MGSRADSKTHPAATMIQAPWFTGDEHILNHGATIHPLYLGYWYCNSFSNYTGGQSSRACDFDIAGITLVAPPPGATRTFPVTFMWESRGVTGDQYQVYLRNYDDWGYHYSPLTAGTSYTLDALPPGFSYGSTNYWSIDVENNSGWGGSYYMRSLTFSSAMNSSSIPSTEPEFVNEPFWLREKTLESHEEVPDNPWERRTQP